MFIKLAFLLGLIFCFIESTVFPSVKLLAFAPVIAQGILSAKIEKSLLLSFFSGLMIDLFSSDPMGIHSLNYTLITLLTYRYRRFFLYDQPLHLGAFTCLFSFSSSILQAFLIFLFDTGAPIAGIWNVRDYITMPLADGIYAMVWFGYPLKGLMLLKKFLHNLERMNLSK